jgi:CRP/FNR family nitrogen fixation transcriptional regulator
MELKARSFPASLEQSGVRRLCRRGDLLSQDRESDDCWGRIIDGAAATCALMTDGRRHVIEFLFPGDLFRTQLLAPAALRTEAISSPTVYVWYAAAQVERAADTDLQVAREIREATLQTVARLKGQIVVLGRAKALEKIAAFLLEMAARTPPRPDSGVVLPMSRYDIADHLGMAVETVSRALSELRSRGTIALEGGRTVKIAKRSTLEQLSAGGNPWGHNSLSAQVSRARDMHDIRPRLDDNAVRTDRGRCARLGTTTRVSRLQGPPRHVSIPADF